MLALFHCLRLLALAAVIALVQACSTLPAPLERPRETAIPASQENALGRAASISLPDGARAPGSDSAFRPLPLSAFAMDARLALANRAQQTLDIQYYLVQNDTTGHAFLRAARDAAVRGVRVRLLVDDLYTADLTPALVSLAAYPNVQIRLFNPFSAGRSGMLSRWTLGLNEFSRINHRMHNKMFIADGAFAIAGGRNIADEYFFSNKGGNFVDFDLLLIGAAVPAMQSVFDAYWNSPRIYPLALFERSDKPAVELQADFERLTADGAGAFPAPPPETADILGFFPLSSDLDKPPLKMLRGSVEVFADDPEKVTGRAEAGNDSSTVTARVGRAIAEVENDLVIGSPYFIPGQLGMLGMARVRARGVNVRVITNSLASNDEPFASAAYARYRVPMLKLGAELFEIETTQLKKDKFIHNALHGTLARSHTKMIVMDKKTTFVGSMNLDFRSSRLNTEFGMLVHSPELAHMALALADRIAAGSYRLRLTPDDTLEWVGAVDGVDTVYDSDPNVDWGTKLQLWLFFPFVSESLL